MPLITGRIGTGKTFIVQCWAGELGVPCVVFKNFRDRWVGATESNLEKIFSVLHALGQVVVFVDEAGEMLIRSGPVRSCLNRLIRKLDLPKLSAHDLRHTHATLLLRAGVNPKVASERLGHADVRITLQIYSHVLPSSQADVITKLDKLLG